MCRLDILKIGQLHQPDIGL
ncbi:hypothetical protein AYI70_g3707, partial [Smittium culicis]